MVKADTSRLFSRYQRASVLVEECYHVFLSGTTAPKIINRAGYLAQNVTLASTGEYFKYWSFRRFKTASIVKIFSSEDILTVDAWFFEYLCNFMHLSSLLTFRDFLRRRLGALWYDSGSSPHAAFSSLLLTHRLSYACCWVFDKFWVLHIIMNYSLIHIHLERVRQTPKD